MVRLKVVATVKILRNLSLFQFHNGSIKSQSESVVATPAETFQFHNGSIKRTESVIMQRYRYTFQFHNGSIKSCSGQ